MSDKKQPDVSDDHFLPLHVLCQNLHFRGILRISQELPELFRVSESILRIQFDHFFQDFFVPIVRPKRTDLPLTLTVLTDRTDTENNFSTAFFTSTFEESFATLNTY